MTRRIVDLSQEIYDNQPVFPGNQRTKIWEFQSFEQASAQGAPIPYATHGLLISDHVSTHVDTPKHTDPSPGAWGVIDMPLDYFVTDAICLDLSSTRSLASITVPQLKKSLQKDLLKIERGCTVLIYTGHYNRTFGTEDWMTAYPGLSPEATSWLFHQGAVGIGIDTPCLDAANSTTLESHRVYSDQKRVIYENLANLDQVAGKKFLWVGLPLKIRGSTGSPVRAVAVLEE
jgi:kynurenine formamidase